MNRKLLTGGGVALGSLALIAGVIVYLANARGAEIAQRRAEVERSIAMGKLVQAFSASRGDLVMKNGARQQLIGARAMLISVKPAERHGTWLALGRTSSGTYFGQRFSLDPDGVMKPIADAQEISAGVAFAEVRLQIAASGATADAAQEFLNAATTGQAAQVRR